MGAGYGGFRLSFPDNRHFVPPPKSDIKRGFTGESNTLHLTSLQTIATQRVHWFARLALLFFERTSFTLDMVLSLLLA